VLLLRLGEDSVPLQLDSLEIVGVRLVSSSKDGCCLGVPTRENLLVFNSKLGNLLGVVLLESLLGRDEVLLSTFRFLESAREVVVLILSSEELGTKSVELGGDVEGLEDDKEESDQTSAKKDEKSELA